MRRWLSRVQRASSRSIFDFGLRILDSQKGRSPQVPPVPSPAVLAPTGKLLLASVTRPPSKSILDFGLRVLDSPRPVARLKCRRCPHRRSSPTGKLLQASATQQPSSSPRSPRPPRLESASHWLAAASCLPVPPGHQASPFWILDCGFWIRKKVARLKCRRCPHRRSSLPLASCCLPVSPGRQASPFWILDCGFWIRPDRSLASSAAGALTGGPRPLASCSKPVPPSNLPLLRALRVPRGLSLPPTGKLLSASATHALGLRIPIQLRHWREPAFHEPTPVP